MRFAPPLLVALVAFSYGFSPIGDENDVWWHLKTGQTLAESGLPENDIFAYTSENIRWHNHEWLSQLGMYSLYRAFEPRQLGGLRAVILAKALILALTFLVVARLATLRAGDVGTGALLALVAVSASRFSIHPRPPVVTYAFAAVFLLLLYGAHERYDRPVARWTRLAFAPVLMALWVNLHGGFLVGIVLVCLFAVGSLADGAFAWIRDGRGASPARARSWTMARSFGWCAVACLIASLINPYGPAIYGMFFRVMSDASLVGAIAELRPPAMQFTPAFEIMILALIVVGSLIQRRLPATVDYLVLVFFLHQALLHVRHLPLFAVTAAPILAWQARGLHDALPAAWKRWWRPALAGACAVIALYMVSARRAGWPAPSLVRNAALARGHAYNPDGYPESVCNFLLAHNYPGRLFNEIHFAGYMIWRLSPDKYRVFSDSRFDIFGGQFNRQAHLIADGVERPSGQKVWRELLDRWGINLVVVDGWKILNHRLEDTPGWRQVYQWRPAGAHDARQGYRVWIREEPIDVPLPTAE